MQQGSLNRPPHYYYSSFSFNSGLQQGLRRITATYWLECEPGENNLINHQSGLLQNTIKIGSNLGTLCSVYIKYSTLKQI